MFRNKFCEVVLKNIDQYAMLFDAVHDIMPNIKITPHAKCPNAGRITSHNKVIDYV